MTGLEIAAKAGTKHGVVSGHISTHISTHAAGKCFVYHKSIVTKNTVHNSYGIACKSLFKFKSK